MSLLCFEGLLDKKLITVLKALQLQATKTSTEAVLFVPTFEGLKLSTDLHQTIQAHLYIPRPLFRTWQWASAAPSSQNEDMDPEEFTLPLNPFIQACELCLSTAKGTSVGQVNGLYRFEWVQGLDTISLRCQDLTFQTECHVSILTPKHIPSLNFSNGENSIPFKMISTGDFLKSALSYAVGKDRFRIVWESGNGSVVIECQDQSGTHQVHISPDSREIQSFTADADISFSYSTFFLSGAICCLSMAKKTSLRINTHGYISLQLMIDMVNDAIFLEYIIPPQIIDEH